MAQAGRLLASPSLADAMAGNVVLIRWWLPIGGLMLVAFSMGRFLLGVWAARRGLVQRPEQHRVLLWRILAWTLPLGVVATALQSGLGQHKEALAWMQVFPGSIVANTIAFAGPLLLGIAIGIGFVLLSLRDGWRRWLHLFAPAGRMALSSYLLQTLACTAVFYGYGLGLGPSDGTPAWFIAWIVLFGAQMAFSSGWLSRYRFGLVEWVWRSLTYGKRQPMRPTRGTP